MSPYYDILCTSPFISRITVIANHPYVQVPDDGSRWDDAFVAAWPENDLQMTGVPYLFVCWIYQNWIIIKWP